MAEKRTELRNALEIMDDLAMQSSLQIGPMNARRFPKPGEAYQRLSEETKAKLSQLKSDDLANMRLDLVLPWVGPKIV